MSRHFNYVAFGNSGLVEGEVGSIEMGRGRMFEYTPTELGKSLEDFSAKSIQFLESLPTFLCTEISSIDKKPTMLIKYGKISNIKAERREISANFDIIFDFDWIEFDSFEQVKSIFDTDRFQLHRTHWAVRDGDPEAVLDKLKTIKPTFSQYVRVQGIGTQQDTTEPPQRSKRTLGTAESIEQYLKILYELPKEDGKQNFFRGHHDKKFELTPSLLRKKEGGSWQFLPNEDKLCKELLIAHYDEFQADHYMFDRLVRMQHYGLPTRLLDISSNPLIALFFACHSDTNNNIDENGEVIVFQILSETIKYFDSDTVSCISNISNLTYAQKNGLDLSLPAENFNKLPSTKKLIHHIKSEKAYFEERLVPDDLGSIVCVKAKQTNSRIRSQSGAFLLYGHEALLPEGGGHKIEVSRVTIRNKDQILKQLHHLNINVTTVYPSIDRTAAQLREQYRLP